MTNDVCLNCDNGLQTGYQYCPQCGQKSAVHRLSFHDVSHDTIHYLTHADKSIFQLLKLLLQQPGIIAREYIAGRRQKYFKPLNFFLIVAGIVVFMTSAFYTPNNSRTRQMENAAQLIQDAGKRQQMLAMAERTQKVSTVTGKYSNIINMLATPFLTLIFWLFYRRRYNYIESLTINMYFTGFIMLFYALLVVPLQNFFPRTGFILLILFFLFEIGYRGFAYKQLCDRAGLQATVKAYGVSFLMTLVWGLLSYLTIAYYIRDGF